MQDFIMKLKQKPEHVRRQIAVGTSAGVTALVGIIWVTTMATSGAFALGSDSSTKTDPNHPPSSDAFALDGTNVKSNFSQLVGAVGSAVSGSSSKPSLKIIDGTTTSSFDTPPASANANPTATVIPF